MFVLAAAVALRISTGVSWHAALVQAATRARVMQQPPRADDWKVRYQPSLAPPNAAYAYTHLASKHAQHSDGTRHGREHTCAAEHAQKPPRSATCRNTSGTSSDMLFTIICGNAEPRERQNAFSSAMNSTLASGLRSAQVPVEAHRHDDAALHAQHVLRGALAVQGETSDVACKRHAM